MRVRRWLRLGGLIIVVLAVGLDITLLLVQDPTALPEPLGPLVRDEILPWAEENVLPWAVSVGLIHLRVPEAAPAVEASGLPTKEVAPLAAAEVTPAPTVVTFPSPTSALLPTALPTATARSVAKPARILAPAIGLDAPVISVGLTADGAMGTPRTAGEVGWYGPRPGEEGNALLAGHVDWVVSGRVQLGSFYRLSRLEPGDVVTILTTDGSQVRFRVIWKRLYEAATAPVDEITGPTGQPSITLITCGGEFDRTLHSYVGRWVVRATLLRSP